MGPRSALAKVLLRELPNTDWGRIRGGVNTWNVAPPYAIEHTSLDTIENQRRDADYFLKTIEGLEPEFAGKLSYRLRLLDFCDLLTTYPMTLL